MSTGDPVSQTLSSVSVVYASVVRICALKVKYPGCVLSSLTVKYPVCVLSS